MYTNSDKIVYCVYGRQTSRKMWELYGVHHTQEIGPADCDKLQSQFKRASNMPWEFQLVEILPDDTGLIPDKIRKLSDDTGLRKVAK